MTRRDLLRDNVDLLSRAARLIQQRPSFRLSVHPASGASRIVVTAASKVPASKASHMIARVDIYANGRPVRSIDAHDGVVRPTRVALGTGLTSTRVAVRAWDRAGRLVAARWVGVPAVTPARPARNRSA